MPCCFGSLSLLLFVSDLTIEKASNHFREFFDKICIIRGIGKITAAVLISMMQELGKTNGKRIRRWRDLPRTRATAVS